jgi:hypothetical protein
MAPHIFEPKLDLQRIGNGQVEIKISYKGVFPVFDRRLASLGLRYVERIEVIGVDPAGSTTGTVLTTFEPLQLPVTDGNVAQIITSNRSKTVSRITLDEDGNPILDPDAIPDQIRCRIRIDTFGFPPPITAAFTNEKVLESVTLPTFTEAESSG